MEIVKVAPLKVPVVWGPKAPLPRVGGAEEWDESQFPAFTATSSRGEGEKKAICHELHQANGAELNDDLRSRSKPDEACRSI